MASDEVERTDEEKDRAVRAMLQWMDKSVEADGFVRKVQTIGTDDAGQPIKIVTWGKP